MRQISLYYNEFYGTLPQKIVSEMKWLTSFEVNSNFLSGTVPPELFAFENLGLINLGDNQYVFSGRRMRGGQLKRAGLVLFLTNSLVRAHSL